jgi:C-terminal processing protease CtpA/Prc
MVTEINDSHGFVYSQRSPTPLSKVFGSWPPVKLAFVGEKLYVVNVGKDSSQDLSKIKMWDEVTTIDAKPVKEAMQRFRTYIASSNEQTFKRDVAGLLIAGPINSRVKLGLIRNGEKLTAELQRNGKMNLSADSISFNDNHKAVEELDQNIGYVNFLKLNQSMVPGMFKTLSKSKAIIFDIRNYPQGTAWQVAPRLAKEKRKAVMFDKPYVNFNNLMDGSEEVSNMKSFFTVIPDRRAKAYDGKIVILCDQNTQSQAEYSIMMFQGATNVTVIGSQTAGADGNVTDVVFPGGYRAYFSGLGIYYPDGTPTQRQGIKIDIVATPTIEGLKAGRDEVMERAIKFINTGK